MASSSSAKKVARVAARSGGGAKANKQSAWLFPAAIVAIVALGVGIVVFARSKNAGIGSNDEKPRARLTDSSAYDHWHASFAINVCGKEQPPVQDVQEDILGIHTHGDGLAHIHPFSLRASGKRATMGKFFDQVGLVVTDDGFKGSDGKVYKAGETTCGGKPTEVVLAHWKDATTAASNKPDQIIRSDFRSVRFSENLGAFTLAIVPKGTTDIAPPSSSAEIESLGAQDGGTSGGTSPTPEGTIPSEGDPTASTPDTEAPPHHGCERLMQAVVLVGGFGTRLRPLTLTTPKQMLPILHKPMIEHVLEHLAHHGITEAVLSMGYRPDAFADAYADGVCAGVKLHYAIEPEPLDTAGAIRFAALHAGIADRFVVVNGDVLTDLDLTALVAFHDAHHGEGTIALHQVQDPSAYGVVPTDDDGRVLAFVEKPAPGEAPTDLINAGTYVLEPAVLDRIADGRKVSIEREVFPAMVADRVLYASPGNTYWIDTGTPAAYLRAQMDLLQGVRGERASGIHPTAVVAPDAVVARSVLGPGVRVDAGAAVRGSVLMAGAHVGAGAVIERAILGNRAEVGPGARVDDVAVLGDDASVGPDLRVSGGSVGVGEHLEVSPARVGEG